MIRRFLLYLSAAAWARGIVTHLGLARRAARRFIAGETLDEAAAATRALNDQGCWSRSTTWAKASPAPPILKRSSPLIANCWRASRKMG